MLKSTKGLKKVVVGFVNNKTCGGSLNKAKVSIGSSNSLNFKPSIFNEKILNNNNNIGVDQDEFISNSISQQIINNSFHRNNIKQADIYIYLPIFNISYNSNQYRSYTTNLFNSKPKDKINLPKDDEELFEELDSIIEDLENKENNLEPKEIQYRNEDILDNEYETKDSNNQLNSNTSFIEYSGPINEEYLVSLINQLLHMKDKFETVKEHGLEDMEEYRNSLNSFKYTILHNFEDEKQRQKIKKAFHSARKSGEALDLMWNLYLNELGEQLEEEEMIRITDLTQPHELYPGARAMKRKIIFHSGPTNSGKTYNAFKALRKAKTGIYCSPLRLLATEAYLKLTTGDEPIENCQLVTGDFKIENDEATHTCSTTEMADISKEYDVAVIDEIQLITDTERGWSWTRALLGVRAAEIHICGEPRVLKLVQKLCDDTGDELEVNTYDRLTPLKITSKPTVKSLQQLEKGDCIVCFSRKEVFKYKTEIENTTKLKVCVVYGGLPPQTRIAQAALFNNENSAYDVLVATDAIGMGLNLNIKRVIFSAVEKYDGFEQRLLTPHETKQIAGRAGRFGTKTSEGEVTAFSKGDCKIIKDAFKYDVFCEEDDLRAGLFPTDEQIDYFAKKYEGGPKRVRLSTILENFYEMSQVNEGKYFMCNLEQKKVLANVLHPIEDLSTMERMTFIKAPFDDRDDMAKELCYRWAKIYSTGAKVPLLIKNPNKLLPIDSLDKLKELETVYKCLNTYCWLSYRIGTFHERELAFDYQEICRELIETALKRTSALDRLQKRKERQEARERDRSRQRRDGYRTRGTQLKGGYDKKRQFSGKEKKDIRKFLKDYNM
ncbi:hypothetical protein ABK040_005894 [Willaertia magna]